MQTACPQQPQDHGRTAQVGIRVTVPRQGIRQLLEAVVPSECVFVPTRGHQVRVSTHSVLGVALNITGLGDVQKGIDLFIADIVAGWASDACQTCDALVRARLGACQGQDLEQGAKPYAQQYAGQPKLHLLRKVREAHE